MKLFFSKWISPRCLLKEGHSIEGALIKKLLTCTDSTVIEAKKCKWSADKKGKWGKKGGAYLRGVLVWCYGLTDGHLFEEIEWFLSSLKVTIKLIVTVVKFFPLVSIDIRFAKTKLQHFLNCTSKIIPSKAIAWVVSSTERSW